MKRLIFKIFVVIIIIVFILAFSESYSALNLDNLAFVVAMGIDTSNTDKIKVTFEFINVPSNSQGDTSKSEIILNTVEASSISNAVSLMNSYLEKRINLSHCKIIVFSEEYAKNGIKDEVYSLLNDIQVRPTSNIIISKCSAKYYIQKSKPILENLVTKYYDVFTSASRFAGYIGDATIGNFSNSCYSKTCDPYAILGGINRKYL